MTPRFSKRLGNAADHCGLGCTKSWWPNSAPQAFRLSSSVLMGGTLTDHDY